MTESADQRLALIDADAHVIETDHTWDYLEPEHQKYRPTLYGPARNGGADELEMQSDQYWMINGRISGFKGFGFSEAMLKDLQSRTGRNVTSLAAAREMDDVQLRLAGMDQLGIDAQVLYNTFWIEDLTDVPEIEGALCHAWNRWMAEVYAQGQGRLFWTCVIPAFDRDQAIEEIRFAKDHGAVGVCMRPFERDHIATDRIFYPIFEEALRHDLPIVVHIANANPELNRILATKQDGSSFGHMGGWSRYIVPTVVAAMSIIMSPVAQDFPDLRWGIIEATGSWVPYLCAEYERRTQTPYSPSSNVFADKHIFVTGAVDDDLSYIVNTVGDNVLMMGTDFGHTDPSSDYDALKKLRSNTKISSRARDAMLSTNAARLYGLGARVKPASTLVTV